VTASAVSVLPLRSIGVSARRFEDPNLLTGRGHFVGDVDLPGMVHLAIIRSELPHAELKGVELDLVRAAPGVIDAFAAFDVLRYMKPIPSRDPLPPSLEPFVEHPLAIDRIRYVGQPVAVVVARSRSEAEDAAAEAVLNYDPLPAVGSVDAALAPDAPRLFATASNVAHELEKAVGDLAQARRAAALVLEERFTLQRLSGMAMETRGLVASFDPQENALAVWGATKVPQHNRRMLARMLELPLESIRYLPTHVGGGFGARGEFYPEDLLVPLASMRIGRPVQWIEDRFEHLLATNHSREGVWEVTAMFDGDGTFVGLDADVLIDFGGYVRTAGANMALFTALALMGPYRLPHFRCRARSVLTNKMGIGTMRSPGAYEGTFVRERLLDMAAEKLGIDRIAIRRHNLVPYQDMPYDTGVPSAGATMVYDGGNYPATLDAVVGALGTGWLAQARAESERAGRRLGVGIACANEGTGDGSFEAARVRREPSGTYRVFVGTTSMGQGHRTTLAQIAADALGARPEEIEVVENDSDEAPPSVGTFASRTAMYAGNAVWLAASDLCRRLREDDVALDTPQEVTREFRSARETFPHAVSAAVIDLDAELATIRILRYVVAAEVGNVINPAVVHGQLQGAAVLGLGGALLEELSYGSDGVPATIGLMDYLMPTALDVPSVESLIMDPDPADNPLGVRGAGEIGTTGAAAALANAVADAIGRADTIKTLPLKPDTIRAALALARRPSGEAFTA
jgi:carbon-monoxide dehydrogenase large subunit